MFDGGGLLLSNFGDCGLDVVLDNAYYSLNPGTGATLCVNGADIAGNPFDDCIEFFVCDTTTEPIDTCPPQFIWHSPADSETLIFNDGLFANMVWP